MTWRKEIPGLGWSSPVVANGRIYLTTGVEAGKDFSLRALCLDAKTGETVWDVEVFNEGAGTAPVPHTKNSHATPTPVVDEGEVFVHFGHMGTCLNVKDGSKVWTQRALKYSPVHGNGGSPVVSGDKLIFSIDGTDKQVIAALEKKSGKVAWQTPRKHNSQQPFSFSTPLLITANGQDQIVSAGSGVVMSLDPKTGKELWRVKTGTVIRCAETGIREWTRLRLHRL